MNAAWRVGELVSFLVVCGCMNESVCGVLIAFDIVGELIALGKSFGGLEKIGCHPWVNDILQGQVKVIPITQFLVYCGIFQFQAKLMPKKVYEKRMRLFSSVH